MNIESEPGTSILLQVDENEVEGGDEGNNEAAEEETEEEEEAGEENEEEAGDKEGEEKVQEEENTSPAKKVCRRLTICYTISFYNN